MSSACQMAWKVALQALAHLLQGRYHGENCMKTQKIVRTFANGPADGRESCIMALDSKRTSAYENH